MFEKINKITDIKLKTESIKALFNTSKEIYDFNGKKIISIFKKIFV